jgi:putative transposase
VRFIHTPAEDAGRLTSAAVLEAGHRHAQWYLAEGAEELCHGLCQALQKRALPRALMSDNGSPMLTAETTEGLARLGILHETTLPYAPFQNGKQEVNLPNISPTPFRLFLCGTNLSRALIRRKKRRIVEVS